MKTRRRGLITASPVKITAPAISRVYRRTRLLDLLDEASRTGQVTWVAAPAGAGKTALALSYVEARELDCLWYQVDTGDVDLATFFHYLGLAVAQAAPRFRRPMPALAPEYLGGAAAFARNFFRELCRRMRRPFVLVLDDMQDQAANDSFHEVLGEGLSELPRNGHAILLSRTEAPKAFARLRVSGRMAELGWDELRVTREELEPLVRVVAPERAASSADVEELHDRSEGWLAGLILLLRGAPPGSHRLGTLSAATSQRLFDYFAAEVFARRPAAVQDFLRATALFPSFTPEMAERLTGYEHARVLLKDLVHGHHFTQQRADLSERYQYHPLFREFLLERAQDAFGAEEIARCRHRAAVILEDAGELEPAYDLFLSGGDPEAAARLISARAGELAATGRLTTLGELIGRLPGCRIEADPWLLYWRGVYRLMYEPARARGDLERAFAMFDARGDPTGSYLSWCAIIESIITEWADFALIDRWIEEFERLRVRYPEFPSLNVELHAVFAVVAALTNRHIYHPSLPPWLERAERLMRNNVDAAQLAWWELQLFWFFLWMGWMNRAERAAASFKSVRNEEHVNPLVRLTRRTNLAIYQWIMGSPATAIRHVEEGLLVAERHGLVFGKYRLLGQGVLASVVRGDPAGAGGYLSQMASTSAVAGGTDAALYRFLASVTALHRGDPGLATAFAAEAVEIGRKCGSPFPLACSLAASASAAIQHRQARQAEEAIAAILTIAERSESRAILLFGYLLDAVRVLQQGDAEAARPAVARALALSRELRGHAQPWLTHAVLRQLYAFALRHEIETDHVEELIRRLGIAGPRDGDLDTWPFAVKVFTLGRFTVLVDGEPLRFSTKAQKKPLDLLKALIALGGRRVLEDALTEILWPEAEGDSAAHALTTTLHRLRRLIGETAIERSEGCLTLNPERCWVDVWSIERQLATAERITRTSSADALDALVNRVFALYRGPFLADKRDEFWVLSRRERLRGRFRSFVRRASSALMRSRRYTQAIQVLERCLEIDPLVEDFYRRLMQAHLAQGRRADALFAYRRCHRLLATHYGLKPSRDTEAIRRRIQAG